MTELRHSAKISISPRLTPSTVFKLMLGTAWCDLGPFRENGSHIFISDLLLPLDFVDAPQTGVEECLDLLLHRLFLPRKCPATVVTVRKPNSLEFPLSQQSGGQHRCWADGGQDRLCAVTSGATSRLSRTQQFVPSTTSLA